MIIRKDGLETMLLKLFVTPGALFVYGWLCLRPVCAGSCGNLDYKLQSHAALDWEEEAYDDEDDRMTDDDLDYSDHDLLENTRTEKQIRQLFDKQRLYGKFERFGPVDKVYDDYWLRIEKQRKRSKQTRYFDGNNGIMGKTSLLMPKDPHKGTVKPRNKRCRRSSGGSKKSARPLEPPGPVEEGETPIGHEDLPPAIDKGLCQ